MTDPYDFDDYEDGDCWNCGGEGFVSDCIDGFCLDAEIGCDLCTSRCDFCNPAKAIEAREGGDGTAPSRSDESAGRQASPHPHSE